MKYYAHFLRHPLARIFLSPLGLGIYGVIVGMSHTTELNWLAVVCLCLILVSAHLIDHYFFVRYNLKKQDAASPLILYVTEGLLWASSLVFMWQHHWGGNLLLLFYLAYIHIKHYPYNLTHSPYVLALNVFFNAFIINNLTYFSQTSTITAEFLFSLFPLIILQIAIQVNSHRLTSQLTGHTAFLGASLVRSLTFLTCLASLIIACYFSFPSQSYWLLQLLFLAGSSLTLLPLLVETQQDTQAQNKLNYLSTSYLIVSLLYALAYCF